MGNGELEDYVKSLISPTDKIDMLGGVSTQVVRQIMRQSDIFLFTSNEGEGWGMVLNEAMAEGCVPVASYSAGATTELVKEGINGLVYYDDDLNELCKKTEILVSNNIMLNRMREESYATIEYEWNADCAIKHLLDMFSIKEMILKSSYRFL